MITQDPILVLAHRGQVLLERSRPDGREGLALESQPTALIVVAVAEHHRLGDESSGTQLLSYLKQIGCAEGAQPVRLGHMSVLRRRLLQGRQFGDNGVGPLVSQSPEE